MDILFTIEFWVFIGWAIFLIWLTWLANKN